MKWLTLFTTALSSLLKNRMRSILTMLGIVIGVAAVIVMVAIGQGAQKSIESRIASLGTNLIMVSSSSSRYGGVSRGAGSRESLTLEDADTLKERATLLAGVSGTANSGGQVIGGGRNWSTQTTGVSPDYLEIRAWELESGTFITERDIRSRSKIAVIGATVAENLFPEQDPVGQSIRIRNIPFKVVGVLKKKGQSAFGQDQDDTILAPLTTVVYRMRGHTNLSQLMVSAQSPELVEQAQEEVREILRQSHKLEHGAEDDFNLRTQNEITEAASATTQTLTMLLGAIAGVSLVVGGIGIMNIMLVSVTERTREIGILIAIGARGSDVLTQFLVEATVLSLLGGASGVAIAYGVGMGLERFMGMTVIFETSVILLALGVSGAIGIFFGFYPAKKASALDPIEALRHE